MIKDVICMVGRMLLSTVGFAFILVCTIVGALIIPITFAVRREVYAIPDAYEVLMDAFATSSYYYWCYAFYGPDDGYVVAFLDTLSKEE